MARDMNDRRVGLWLIGALGGVGTTAALGLAALSRRLTDETSLVTALPLFNALDLDEAGQFVVGGHDIRRGSFSQSVREFQQRANVFDRDLTDACQSQLEAWTENIRPGTVLGSGATIARLADWPEAQKADSCRASIDRIQTDLRLFREKNRLDQVVVLNVASTEPPFDLGGLPPSLDQAALEKRGASVLPSSSL